MFFYNLVQCFYRFLCGLVPQPAAVGAAHPIRRIGARPIRKNILLFAKKRPSQGDDRREVEADRRRKTTSQGQRERAAAPSRDKGKPPASTPPTVPPSYPPGGGSGSYGPPSGGTGGFGFPASSGSPGGGFGGFSPLMLILGAGLVLLICVGAFFLFSGGLGGGQPASSILNAPANPSGGFGGVQQPSNIQQEALQQQAPSLGDSDFQPPKTGEGEETWLVMLYQDADDKILEQDIYLDLNEAERIGSSDNVHIVSQVDRYRAGYSGDGNWTDTRRYYLTFDPDLNRVTSQELMNLGEVNMASGDSLVDFVTWAVASYPADKHVLILSDHGMGWPGGWTDPDPGGFGPDRVAMAQATGDQLFLMELDQALAEIRRQTGLDKFELIGMDACLMGHVEVFNTLAPHARYAVASQEVEPALGWAYTGFLANLLADPGINGADLGQSIVSTYIDEDQRITDNQARVAWLGRGSIYGVPSALQLSRQIGDDVTLAAVDLQKMPQVMDALNTLAYLLQNESQRGIAEARNYAQSFTSVFGRSVPPSYLDLSNLVGIVKQNTRDPQVQRAADALQASIDDAVIAERHGRKKPGATGMSIYFPNSQLYRNPATGAQSYAEIASRFAEQSLWDDFLAYHYTGRPFGPAEQSPAVPEAAQVTSPAQGQIIVSALQVSSAAVDIGETVMLSADIEGENIGYIKFFAGFLDEASNSIYVADTDYLDSGQTREVDGVYYPDWGEGAFTLSFDWEPIVFAIDDGDKRAVALFEPEVYGASADDAVYAVDGIYTYADGEEFRATMYFNNSDGLLREVFGYTGSGSTGAPREILPSPGDTFTVLERWLDINQAGRPATPVAELGDTVSFGTQQFAWIDLDAAAGPYVVGFLIEDLDGNVYPVYEEVTVN